MNRLKGITLLSNWQKTEAKLFYLRSSALICGKNRTGWISPARPSLLVSK
jgi:hypothetical protein